MEAAAAEAAELRQGAKAGAGGDGGDDEGPVQEGSVGPGGSEQGQDRQRRLSQWADQMERSVSAYSPPMSPVRSTPKSQVTLYVHRSLSIFYWCLSLSMSTPRRS